MFEKCNNYENIMGVAWFNENIMGVAWFNENIMGVAWFKIVKYGLSIRCTWNIYVIMFIAFD